jgi:cell division protein FtsL
MNRLLAFLVAVLLAVDLVTLTAVQKWRGQPPAPDLAPRVAQLEKDVSQAQQDIGELKQEVQLLARRGRPDD